MGITMFVQQRLSPQSGDPMQQKVFMFMPIIFTFLFLQFQSGLVLYWLTNNILSIAQQYFINKKTAA
jgi:YidC/Oxa1 family membrane protein insertase